ncbi:MAG: DNA integrity scanning protein DisA nucleotide-binding domain protein, partial [Thermoguttaceae bacterium]|nr:DNA integrity scanning protein DisA nucleotide-binding domain protein [Thermoguttaceae bacterium]
MENMKFTDNLQKIWASAVGLSEAVEAAGLLALFEAPIDWARLRKFVGEARVAVASTKQEILDGAKEAGFDVVLVDLPEDSPPYERLSSATLQSVVDDVFHVGYRIVAVYGFADSLGFDSMSVVNLGRQFEKLSGKTLRKMDSIPYKTLKTTLELALEIGREGREGKAIGTLFVVGDTKNVLAQSVPAGFDPVKGYNAKERNLFNAKVREGVKEIAQLDGAIVVNPDGVVVAACRLLNVTGTTITLSKGLGARHWAAAAITRKTKAAAFVVSQSGGAVRVFVNGEVVLRIERGARVPFVWEVNSE